MLAHRYRSPCPLIDHLPPHYPCIRHPHPLDNKLIPAEMVSTLSHLFCLRLTITTIEHSYLRLHPASCSVFNIPRGHLEVDVDHRFLSVRTTSASPRAPWTGVRRRVREWRASVASFSTALRLPYGRVAANLFRRRLYEYPAFDCRDNPWRGTIPACCSQKWYAEDLLHSEREAVAQPKYVVLSTLCCCWFLTRESEGR